MRDDLFENKRELMEDVLQALQVGGYAVDRARFAIGRPDRTTLALVTPFGTLIYRLAYEKLADATVLVLLIAGISAFFSSVAGKEVWARLQLKTPGVGKIFTMVALCRFCRIFGTLLANGIPIIQALKIARDSAGNSILAFIIDQLLEVGLNEFVFVVGYIGEKIQDHVESKYPNIKADYALQADRLGVRPS